MRNTYTFMRKMYRKLPLGPFLFPSRGFSYTWFCFIFPCRAGLQRLISSFYPRCFSHSHLKIQIHPRPVITCAWQVQALWLSNGIVSRGALGRGPIVIKEFTLRTSFLETKIKKPANNFWRSFFCEILLLHSFFFSIPLWSGPYPAQMDCSGCLIGLISSQAR